VWFLLVSWWSSELFRGVKANLHWGHATSSRARFFVCLIVPSSCRAKPCTSAELPDATKQRITPGNSWHVLSVDWPLLLNCAWPFVRMKALNNALRSRSPSHCCYFVRLAEGKYSCLCKNEPITGCSGLVYQNVTKHKASIFQIISNFNSKCRNG